MQNIKTIINSHNANMLYPKNVQNKEHAIA